MIIQHISNGLLPTILIKVVHHAVLHCEKKAFKFKTGIFMSPSTIKRRSHTVTEAFHARFSATARSYTYVLLNSRVRQPLWAGRAGWVFQPLDVPAMTLAAQSLLGEHDFSSFRSSQCQAKSPVRTISELSLVQKGDLIFVSLRGNAFLHHMVRNIIGALVQIGQGRESVRYIADLLALKDRTKGAPTFAPDGLYLTEVSYPQGLVSQQQSLGFGLRDLGLE
jgi:tRNA pseudouridine38-40 synthase